MSDLKAICQGCNSEHDVDDLDDIDKIVERIGPGDTAVPIGQCPHEDCGALCHAAEDVERMDNQARLHQLCRELLVVTKGDRLAKDQRDGDIGMVLVSIDETLEALEK